MQWSAGLRLHFGCRCSIPRVSAVGSELGAVTANNPSHRRSCTAVQFATLMPYPNLRGAVRASWKEERFVG
jgi:hypothetical protein